MGIGGHGVVSFVIVIVIAIEVWNIQIFRRVFSKSHFPPAQWIWYFDCDVGMDDSPEAWSHCNIWRKHWRSVENLALLSCCRRARCTVKNLDSSRASGWHVSNIHFDWVLV